MATPRSNSACTLGSQEVGKLTLPSFWSSWAATRLVSAAVIRPAAESVRATVETGAILNARNMEILPVRTFNVAAHGLADFEATAPTMKTTINCSANFRACRRHQAAIFAERRIRYVAVFGQLSVKAICLTMRQRNIGAT